MNAKSNPLLTYLTRREPNSLLSGRRTLLLAAFLLMSAVLILLTIMKTIDDGERRGDFQEVFGLMYLFYGGLSLVMPVILAVFGAILTTQWTGQDEKFDLLRLTTLSDRAFVEAYLGAVLHRTRLIIGFYVILAFVTPMMVVVSSYWNNNPAYYSGFPNVYLAYNDTPFSNYVGSYILFLLINVALSGLSLIGAAMGVRYGLYYRSMTSAISTSLATTCFSLLALTIVTMCGSSIVGVFLAPFSNHSAAGNLGAFVPMYACVGGLCLFPVVITFANVLQMAERVVRQG